MKRTRSRKVALIPARRIERAIVNLRGQNVMLDADLASLYRVTTRELVQAVKRNLVRFPADFMFRLTGEEMKILRSQSVISRSGHGGRRTPPYAFTEHGVAMLSSVLKSSRAVQVSIEIVRGFVSLRHMLQSTAELGKKLDALEMKYDARFKIVFQAIRELMLPRSGSAKRIGFRPAHRD